MSHASNLMEILERHARAGREAKLRERENQAGERYRMVHGRLQEDGSMRQPTDEEIAALRYQAESEHVLQALLRQGYAEQAGDTVSITPAGLAWLVAHRREQFQEHLAKLEGMEASILARLEALGPESSSRDFYYLRSYRMGFLRTLKQLAQSCGERESAERAQTLIEKINLKVPKESWED